MTSLCHCVYLSTNLWCHMFMLKVEVSNCSNNDGDDYYTALCFQRAFTYTFCEN